MKFKKFIGPVFAGDVVAVYESDTGASIILTVERNGEPAELSDYNKVLLPVEVYNDLVERWTAGSTIRDVLVTVRALTYLRAA